AIATLMLTSCSTARYRWSLSDAALSPSAQRLPRQELEQIVRLVSPAFIKRITAIGRECSRAKHEDEMNVIVEYTGDGWWLYKLKKSSGQWHVTDQGILHFSFFATYTGC